MKASAVIVLVAVVTFSMVMALVPAVGPHSAQAADPPEAAGGGRITIVKEGQLICVANAVSVATFRVEDNGMLRRIDVDVLPNIEMAKGSENQHIYENLFGSDP